MGQCVEPERINHVDGEVDGDAEETRTDLDSQERKQNNVPLSFLSPLEETMKRPSLVKSFVEEAAALTSLALFIGMIAIWAQVIATL